MLGPQLTTAGEAMEERVQWTAHGLRYAGIVHRPEGMQAGKRRAAFMVLHGFGSNKDSGTMKTAARLFTSLGYVALRFDMRGCGESEGERGRVICLEQVADTSGALEYLGARHDVNAKRIAAFGHSFGAAVAVYAAGVDERIAACISSGGWGNGQKKFRRQHESHEAWAKFSAMLEEGRRRAQRGERMMVPRFDIVPIRPELRGNLAPGSHLEFPFEVVESMYAFTANDVVGRIAPRPLLLLHPAHDTVTPTEQSIDLFLHAGQPADLHLFAQTDHFLFSDGNAMVHSVLRDWLARYLPAT
jgi:alpha-beta hydrolase superfamily lysophospholipase